MFFFIIIVNGAAWVCVTIHKKRLRLEAARERVERASANRIVAARPVSGSRAHAPRPSPDRRRSPKPAPQAATDVTRLSVVATGFQGAPCGAPDRAFILPQLRAKAAAASNGLRRKASSRTLWPRAPSRAFSPARSSEQLRRIPTPIRRGPRQASRACRRRARRRRLASAETRARRTCVLGHPGSAEILAQQFFKALVAAIRTSRRPLPQHNQPR